MRSKALRLTGAPSPSMRRRAYYDEGGATGEGGAGSGVGPSGGGDAPGPGGPGTEAAGPAGSVGSVGGIGATAGDTPTIGAGLPYATPPALTISADDKTLSALGAGFATPKKPEDKLPGSLRHGGRARSG